MGNTSWHLQLHYGMYHHVINSVIILTCDVGLDPGSWQLVTKKQKHEIGTSILFAQGNQWTVNLWKSKTSIEKKKYFSSQDQFISSTKVIKTLQKLSAKSKNQRIPGAGLPYAPAHSITA